jgi:hypothetical protein
MRHLPIVDDQTLLDDIRIATPCDVAWDTMAGTDRVRYCGQCRLNVYDVSQMTATDAAALIRRGSPDGQGEGRRGHSGPRRHRVGTSRPQGT